MLSHGGVESIHASTPQEQPQARLADPHTIDALNQFLDRVDVIAASVEMVDGFLRRSSEVADKVSESLEEIRGQVDHEEIHLIEKLPKLARAGSRPAESRS